MPTLGEIQKTINESVRKTVVEQTKSLPQGQQQLAQQQLTPQLTARLLEETRRKYLKEYSEYTGRRVFLYASCWLQKPNASRYITAINDEDMQGFMEIMNGVQGKSLDLILHSAGGFPDAAEMIVAYLRTKFDDVRVVVPHMAMSAATMIACSANKIIMGKHSSLGPIDPQISQGNNVAPAGAILDQFELAKLECSDPKTVNAWIPILPQYGPALLKQCKYAQELAEELVTKWLIDYMFRGQPDADKTAACIAGKLAAHTSHKSHGRHLARATVLEYGLLVDSLEDDQRLQDLALSVYHCTTLMFHNSAVVKIIENDDGKAFMKQELPQQTIGMLLQQPNVGPVPSPFIQPQKQP